MDGYNVYTMYWNMGVELYTSRKAFRIRKRDRRRCKVFKAQAADDDEGTLGLT